MHKGGKLRKLEVRVLKDMHLHHRFIIQRVNRGDVADGNGVSKFGYWFVRTKRR